MKTLFLFLALCMVSTFAEAANNNYIDATGVVKTRMAQYLAVKNSSAGALTRGMAVCLDTTDDDGVNVDLCAGEGFKPVGVVVDVSCAIGAPCKLQTKGFFAYGKFDYLATATIVGGMIYADSDGDLTRPATVLVSHFPVGTTFDAVAADSTALEIYIDL